MSCPWYITRRAVEDYCEIRGWPDDDEHFDRGEDELMLLVDGAKHVRDQDNGLQLWRGKAPHRYRLLVSTARRPEGELPQLVRVLPESDRGAGPVAPVEDHVEVRLPKVPRSKMVAWRDAARRADQSLSQWAVETLDAASRVRRPSR